MHPRTACTGRRVDPCRLFRLRPEECLLLMARLSAIVLVAHPLGGVLDVAVVELEVEPTLSLRGDVTSLVSHDVGDRSLRRR